MSTVPFSISASKFNFRNATFTEKAEAAKQNSPVKVTFISVCVLFFITTTTCPALPIRVSKATQTLVNYSATCGLS